MDIDKIIQNVKDLIDQHGHAVIGTVNNGQYLSYTVGLPVNLAITCIDHKTAKVLLNRAAKAFEGKAAEDGSMLEYVANHPLKVKYLKAHACNMIRAVQGDSADVALLIWPPANGETYGESTQLNVAQRQVNLNN